MDDPQVQCIADNIHKAGMTIATAIVIAALIIAFA